MRPCARRVISVLLSLPLLCIVVSPGAALADPPPAEAALVAPPTGGQTGFTSTTLEVSVSDPESDPLTVSFYARPRPLDDSYFTLVVLPDTQYYTSSLFGGTPQMLTDQTQWAVDNLTGENIAFVTHVGDCVENGDNGGDPTEWEHVDHAFSLLEDPLTTGLAEGIPFGLAVGNRDQSPAGDAYGTTNFYNQFFGEARFQGRSYYGGHFGSDNDNHFELFQVAGMDFLIVHLEYSFTGLPSLVGDWLEALLSTYSDRRAIIVSHHIINADASFNFRGNIIYDRVKPYPNVFLMLSGHTPGESRRTDQFNGSMIHSVMADYQGRTNGGNGWMRRMHFYPARNEIQVRSHSPTLNQFETDDDSQFSLPYDMGGDPFELVGAVPPVPSGSVASLGWSGLDLGRFYDWYVEADDGLQTILSPVWSFETPSPNFVEDFDDGMLGYPWASAAGCGSVEASAGRLLLTKDEGCGSSAALNSEPSFFMSGDFVIETEFELLDFDPPVDGYRFQALQVKESGGALLGGIERWRSQLADPCASTSDGYRAYANDSALCASTFAAASESAGALRLERQGNVLRARYRSGDRWSAPLLETVVSTATVGLSLSTGSNSGLMDRQEVAFDDLRILAGTVTSSPEAARVPTPAVVLLPNRPNPFNPRTTISFRLESELPVRVHMRDARGRTIRTLFEGTRGRGVHELVWDGRDDSGRGVASGVYYCEITTPSGRAARKLALIR